MTLELIFAAAVVRVVFARQLGVAAMPLSKKLGAEFIGTFWLVLGGGGSAVLYQVPVNETHTQGIPKARGI